MSITIVILEFLAVLSVSFLVGGLVYLSFMRTERGTNGYADSSFTVKELEDIATEARGVRGGAEKIESRANRLKTLSSLKKRDRDSAKGE